MPISPASRRNVAFTGPRAPSSERKDVTYGINRQIDDIRADFNQQKTNACGTTALAIAMHRLGVNIPRQTIDRQVRNFNLYTSAGGIIDYARQKGFQANRYENGSFDQLKSDLAAGRQVIVLADVGGYDQDGLLKRGSDQDFNLHYMNVTDVGYDKNGQRYVTYWTWGREETVPYERFEQFWSILKIAGVNSDFNRSYLLVDKGNAAALRAPGKLPSSEEHRLMDGVSQAANGVGRTARGDLGGLRELGRGVVNTLRGAGEVALDRVRRWFR